MECLVHRGEFADVPWDQMVETFRRGYGMDSSWNQADFDREAQRETREV